MAAGRFRSLDALRGIAALMVVLYHADALFHLGGWSPPLAFLAVDLFFCLSGFVLSKAYDDRLATGLSPAAFIWIRIQRLFPLYLLGWLLALVAWVAAGTFAVTAYTVATLGLNALMLPGFGRMFPANPPAWSLFFELWVANLIFAIFWRQISGWRLCVIILVSLFGFIATERHFHDFNLGFEWATFAGGIARVMFSFFLGVGVARYQERYPSGIRVPALLLLAILACVLSFSFVGQARQIQQVVCVTLVFPIIIYLGASAKERRPEIGMILGDASYAVYILHWPTLIIVNSLFRYYGFVETGFAVQLFLTVSILFGALIVHRRFDTPLRRSIAVRRDKREV